MITKQIKNILVIDDELVFIKEELELLGYYCTQFNHLDEAYIHLIDNPFLYDLVLVDENFSKSNKSVQFSKKGTIFGQRVSTNINLNHIPLAMMTGKEYNVIQCKKAFKSGFIDFELKDSGKPTQTWILEIENSLAFKRCLALRDTKSQRDKIYFTPESHFCKDFTKQFYDEFIVSDQFLEFNRKVDIEAFNVLLEVSLMGLNYNGSHEFNQEEQKFDFTSTDYGAKFLSQNKTQLFSHKLKDRPGMRSHNLEILSHKLISRRVLIGYSLLFSTSADSIFKLKQVTSLLWRGDITCKTKGKASSKTVKRWSSPYWTEYLGLTPKPQGKNIYFYDQYLTPEELAWRDNFIDLVIPICRFIIRQEGGTQMNNKFETRNMTDLLNKIKRLDKASKFYEKFIEFVNKEIALKEITLKFFDFDLKKE